MSKRRTSTKEPKPTTAGEPQPPAVTPDAPLTNDEEEAFSLLVDFANAQKAKEEKPRQPQKTRVEFSQLVTRAGAVRFLLLYFSGSTPGKAMAEAGINWGDLQICRLASPDFDAAFKFCQQATAERLTLKALDNAEKALDGRIITKEAASLSKFLLERLAADRFGDPRYKAAGGAGAGGGGQVYNINIIQAAAAPVMCGGSVAQPLPNTKSAENGVINV